MYVGSCFYRLWAHRSVKVVKVIVVDFLDLHTIYHERNSDVNYPTCIIINQNLNVYFFMMCAISISVIQVNVALCEMFNHHLSFLRHIKLYVKYIHMYT